ncbi:MAG TPA: hypothetical protein PL033_04415 [Candidatus Brocadiia bacterium]|nr:hypothetical protein [Candidatus Brocadiia bacterium]
MQNREWETGADAGVHGGLAEAARAAVIVAGLGLIAVGLVFVIRLFLAIEELRSSPANSKKQVEEMVEIIHGKDIVVPVVQGTELELGNTIGLGFYILLIMIEGWFCCALFAAGGRLVASASPSRQMLDQLLRRVGANLKATGQGGDKPAGA